MDDHPASHDELAERRKQAQSAHSAIRSALAEIEKLIDNLAVTYTDPCRRNPGGEATRSRG